MLELGSMEAHGRQDMLNMIGAEMKELRGDFFHSEDKPSIHSS